MFRSLPLACLFRLSLLCVNAQTFDVASIRPHPTEDDRFGVKMPAEGQFRATGATAKQLVMLAFDIQDTQIANGPAWLDSLKWDVEAKSASNEHSVEETRRMLQSMLRERFQLRAHQETQQRPAYVLTVAKGGPKFKVATEGATNIRVAANSIRLERGKISQMTQVLSASLERPVMDRTGLGEEYDLLLQWDDAPRNSGVAAPGRDYGSVFTALQEQLGLQLESQQVSVEIVVIDRVERPSQN